MKKTWKALKLFKLGYSCERGLVLIITEEVEVRNSFPIKCGVI